MAKIRPSIYVGLGGTGIKSISQTKKMFEDAFGKNNIPPQIAFAAIDFDLAEDPNLPTSMHEDYLQVNNAGSPRQLYEVRSRQGEYKWMFPCNANYIGTLICDGASQVRTYGRFLTEMIINNIERRIADCYTQVTNIQADIDIDVEKTSTVDVHIAMSLAGGTGCGSFINVASMLRDRYQNKIKIIGYGVLHGVFRTMDPSTNKTPRVVANAYSAVLDLDYLMTASAENPIQLTLNGKNTELKQSLYDEFFIVDNETENGKRVSNISQLCEVIGMCMYVAGSEMGSKIQSGQSNTHWKNGGFNISPKLGWVQGLGACQIVYKGDLLAEIYGLKAAIELIRKLQSKDADVSQKALAWAEEKSIREDGDDFNMLIDAIYPYEKIESVKNCSLDVKDTIAEVQSSVMKYIDKSPADFPEDSVNKARTTAITDALTEYIADTLKQESGVGNASVFLASLREYCLQYKSEMDEERKEKDKEAGALLEKLNTKTYKAYKDYLEKIIKTKNGKQEHLDQIQREAKAIRKLTLESRRRTVAYNTYTTILETVNAKLLEVENINKILTALQNDYNLALAKKQNKSESALVFEYDLSANERINMKFNPDDIVVSNFTAHTKPLLNYGVAKDLDNEILTYTGRLKQAVLYREKLIIDVIKDLPEEEYKRLKKEVTDKSSRLLKLNDRGQVSKTRNNQLPTSMMVQNYLISLYGNSDTAEGPVKSRLEADGEFLRDIKKEYIYSDFDSMKQKIIFYRADMAIIPYCIDSFDDLVVESEYDILLREAIQAGSTSFNPHFDMQIFDEMRNKDFKLKPEMQNEAMFYWVCGHFFGWREITEDMHIMEKDRDGDPIRCIGKEEVTHPKYIRIKAGKYMYWDENGNPGKDQKWQLIDNTAMRNHAYNFFKTTIFPAIKTVLNKKIVDEITNRGENYYVTKVQNIIDNGIHDYINCIVCSNKNSSTISSQNGAEWNQYLDEWNFIEKDLINSLKNIK